MLTQNRHIADLVASKLDDIRRLCVEAKVRMLEVYGSAATDEMTDDSDIDFLVEFLPLEPGQHADCYFRLLFGLEDLFEREIDLSESTAVRNPYLLQDIEEARQVLYAS